MAGGTKGDRLVVSGRKKTFTQELRQNRWEPAEPLAVVSSSQQMKLVGFGVLSLVGSAFPKLWGRAEWLPRLSAGPRLPAIV